MQRFAEKVEIGEDDDSCWLWTGATITPGYGTIYLNGATHYVHRVAYTLFRGPIPLGLDIDHLCRVRHCCNPWHLEPVTRQENLLRGIGIAAMKAKQTHCIRGHAFSVENIYRNRNGTRACRICKKMHNDARKG